MSEMIERVAKALYNKDFPKQTVEWKKLQQKYHEAAKAAIEAMCEPTEAMLDAGAYDLDMTLEQQYKNMIEAALK